MSNFSVINNSFLDSNYNITAILTTSPVDNPEQWLSVVNQELAGWMIVTILYVLGVVLFYAFQKFNPDKSDSFALVYSGLIVSLLGAFFFLVDVGTPGIKLIYWYQLAPMLIVTALAIAIDRFKRQY